MSWKEAYDADHAKQKSSGPIEFTEEQREKNLKLRDRIADILPIDDCQKVNDCDLLYRFLIGRHWSVSSAEEFLRNYVKLRHEKHLNTVLAEEFEPEVMAVLATVYGVDKTNEPNIWMAPDPAKLLPMIKKYPKEHLLKAQMYTMEAARFLSRARDVDRCTYVLDLDKITLASINSTTMTFLRELISILQEDYPEIMYRLLIFNAGWIIIAAWKVLKPFVDVRVQEKIHFHKGPPCAKSLAEFMDTENILPRYGGTGKQNVLEGPLNEEIARQSAVRKGAKPPPAAAAGAEAGGKSAAPAAAAGKDDGEAAPGENAQHHRHRHHHHHHDNNDGDGSEGGSEDDHHSASAGGKHRGGGRESPRSSAPLEELPHSNNNSNPNDNDVDLSVQLYSLYSSFSPVGPAAEAAAGRRGSQSESEDRWASSQSGAESADRSKPPVVVVHSKELANPLSTFYGVEENYLEEDGESGGARSLTDAPPSRTSRPASGMNASGTSPRSPDSPLKRQPSMTVELSMAQGTDGYVAGFYGSEWVGECRNGVVYGPSARDADTASLRTCETSASPAPPALPGASGEPVSHYVVGELLREAGHPIHVFLIVCDAQRKARFVLRKSLLRSVVSVFQVVGDATVKTDRKLRHRIAGQKVKMGEVVAPKAAAARKDPGAWVLYGEDVTDRHKPRWIQKLSSTSPNLSSSNYPNGSESASQPDSSQPALLAECLGQSVTFRGALARGHPTDLFTLAVAIEQLWLDADTSSGSNGVQKAFRARKANSSNTRVTPAGGSTPDSPDAVGSGEDSARNRGASPSAGSSTTSRSINRLFDRFKGSSKKQKSTEEDDLCLLMLRQEKLPEERGPSLFGRLLNGVGGCDLKLLLTGKADADRVAVDDVQNTVRKRLHAYEWKEPVAGRVVLTPNGSSLKHKGLLIELIGCITVFTSEARKSVFLHQQRQFEPDTVTRPTPFEFNFSSAKEYESYYGINATVTYHLKVTVQRTVKNTTHKEELWITRVNDELSDAQDKQDAAFAERRLSYFRENTFGPQSVSMEVGVSNLVHIEFRYHKRQFHLGERVLGRVSFKVADMDIQYGEVGLIRKEYIGLENEDDYESETLQKYEIMDGTPIVGEVVPIRLYLKAVPRITPTYANVHGCFRVRYFLNLVLVTSDSKRYFKQQEITLYRRRGQEAAPGSGSTAISPS